MNKNNSPTRILVIDDDRELCRLIKEYLESSAEGYWVEFVHSGIAGLSRIIRERWQAIILDVMIPGMDGFEVLKKIRNNSDVPVLMLTARGGEDDRINGLEMGADDYLPKTFSTRELSARVKAVIRRTTGSSISESERKKPQRITAGPLTIDSITRRVFLNKQEIILTPVEFDLLLDLVFSRGKIKSRESLLEECRKRSYDVHDRSIDMHISSLRKKLGDDPADPHFIKTIRSAGYIFLKSADVHS